MKTVLLLEPDKVLQNLYVSTLESTGYTVVSASTAQEAISLADSAKPDAIVLELQLVEHSGIEFLYELRSYADWQKLPVVINTIVPPSEFKDNYELLMGELGAKSYLYKPDSSLKELTSSINELNIEHP